MNANPIRTACCRIVAIAAAFAPGLAHASIFKGEALDTFANYLALFILLAVPIGGIALFWLVHILPEVVAEKRHHPQKEAIKILCLLSLVFGGLLWPLAWIWAYTKPVLHKLSYGTDKHEDYYRELAEQEAKGAEALADEMAKLRQQLTALAQRGARPDELSAMHDRLAVIEARLPRASAEHKA
jgi:CBS domain containing-hemolysin-like protein